MKPIYRTTRKLKGSYEVCHFIGGSFPVILDWKAAVTRTPRDALIFRQLETRRTLQRRIVRLKNLAKDREQSLTRDIDQYREIRDKQKNVFDIRNRTRTRDNPPDRER